MQGFQMIAAALAPLIFAVLAALGVQLSDDLKDTITENLGLLLLALGALGSAVPGVRAAWNARKVALETVKTEEKQP